MHSVAPQQTVTFLSGSQSVRPLNARTCLAIACRSTGAPHVMAYWLCPSWIARQAASFSSCGVSKSGMPCARLIAPCRLASRVISRMTDSLKYVTRCASMRGVGMGRERTSAHGSMPDGRRARRARLLRRNPARLALLEERGDALLRLVARARGKVELDGALDVLGNRGRAEVADQALRLRDRVRAALHDRGGDAQRLVHQPLLGDDVVDQADLPRPLR